MQRSRPVELVFGPVDLVVYLSTILTSNPGDMTATGPPGGVGSARRPPRYPTDDDAPVTAIGIGECRNTRRAEVSARAAR